MKYSQLTAIVMVTTLTVMLACSTDDARQQDMPQGSPLQLVSVTRSVSNDADLADIKLYMTRDSKNGATYEGLFERTAEGWNNLVSVNAEPYHVYGYMPSGVATGSLAERDATSHFLQGAVLTLDGLPTVTDHDVCALTSVRKPSETGFAAGSFAYDNYNPQESDLNKICLHLDHLYASVRFKLAIGSSRNYSSLRTIRMQQLKLTAPDQQKLVVTLQQGTGISSVVSTMKSPLTTSDYTIYTGTDELAATGDTLTVTAYFLPEQRSNLSLVASYDVYDKQGTLVREVRELRNKLNISELARGQQQTLKLTIEPTYLYQLSDGDLDNPVLKIQ